MSALSLLSKASDGVKKVFTKPMMLQCGVHGEVRACFVCSHIVETLNDGAAVGFNWERQIHNINASCDDCNAMILANGNDWSEGLMETTGVEVICENCVAIVAKINGMETFQ